MMPSFTELLVLLGIALIVFGGAKLPQVGDGIGRAISNFKRGIGGRETDDRPATTDPQDKPTPPKA